MKIVILGLILCIGVVLVCGEDSRPRRYFNVDMDDIGDKVNKAVKCRTITNPCRLVPACCGSLQCYWEHGYNPLSSGVCVECIDTGLKCQRDSQCCAGNVCIKDNAYAVDGLCAAKLSKGASCYKDNHCGTHYCEIDWIDMIRGSGGVCTETPQK